MDRWDETDYRIYHNTVQSFLNTGCKRQILLCLTLSAPSQFLVEKSLGNFIAKKSFLGNFIATFSFYAREKNVKYSF